MVVPVATRTERIVGVFHKVRAADFASDDDGLGPLSDLNIVDIDALDMYLAALKRRVR